MEKRKLSELKADNPYLRLGTDVTELEKSIKTLGLIAPLVISPENVILAGARRYQALLNLGYTEAPVMIINGNSLEKELVSIDENLVRKDLSKMEIESHLRRAKEIYQKLHPSPVTEEIEQVENKETLPALDFLEMVSEKTGLSTRQIHEAITRDEKAASSVKEARLNGELSLSQTNEIVKLKKNEQDMVIEHIKELPVREIKKFVKIAQAQGVEQALHSTSQLPHQREFADISSLLKKLIKKMNQLKFEKIEIEDYPEELQNLLSQLSDLQSNHYLSGVQTESSSLRQ